MKIKRKSISCDSCIQFASAGEVSKLNQNGSFDSILVSRNLAFAVTFLLLLCFFLLPLSGSLPGVEGGRGASSRLRELPRELIGCNFYIYTLIPAAPANITGIYLYMLRFVGYTPMKTRFVCTSFYLSVSLSIFNLALTGHWSDGRWTAYF